MPHHSALRTAAFFTLFAALGGGLLAACGGAAGPPASEAPMGAPAADAPVDEGPAGEPAKRQLEADSRSWTLEQARAAFEQSEQRLAGLLPEPGMTRGDDFAQPPPPAPAEPVAKQPGRASGGGDLSRRLSRCQQACRALGSMQRAAGRLCQLAGERDRSCARVLELSERARVRVERACPDCAAARRP